MLVRIFDHYNRAVDHRADRDRDSAQRHDVRDQARKYMTVIAINIPTGRLRIATKADGRWR